LPCVMLLCSLLLVCVVCLLRVVFLGVFLVVVLFFLERIIFIYLAAQSVSACGISVS